MILSAHQLHYLPWLRYFHKIAQSDIFVVMDNIQFNKNGWQNRNKIKTKDGWMYLTVPVLNKYQQKLDEVKIDNTQNWQKKHLNSLISNYAKAPYFGSYRQYFEKIYQMRWPDLNSINLEMLKLFLGALGIKTKIVLSSALKQIEGTDSLRLVDICKALGADTYLSGAYAAGVYLDENIFKDAGINVKLQDWRCSQYQQQFKARGFIPDLAIADLLFNCGEKSLSILLSETVKV